MSFQGINFSSQHIVPSDDGRLYEAIFEDGALHGCELSYVGAALTVGAGYLMIGGREIEITEDEVFNINEATSGYAQLVLTIDLTQTATVGAFSQVSIDVRYASTEAGFASLIQDDINGAGTKYQQQLALVSLGTGGITGIVAGMPSASLKGAGRVFSIISVTYPEGSICTCSDGTTTLTARDTSGKALFNVPSAGTWTVTARSEDGNKETNKTVGITDGGQCASVALFFEFVLYETGKEYTDITGGWYASDKHLSPTLSKNENNMTITLPTGSDIAVAPKSAINLTAYSALKIRFSKLAYKPNGYQYWGLSQSATGFTIGTYSAVAKLGTAVNNVVSCDIAEVTSAQFAKLVISGLNDGEGTITTVIEKIWAE